MCVFAVVLAAGASSRYGAEPPKQVELLPKVLAALGESSVHGVVVVSGAHALPVESVPCADWERGPGASLRCGLAGVAPIPWPSPDAPTPLPGTAYKATILDALVRRARTQLQRA